MTWNVLFWTAVIPSVPLVTPGAGWLAAAALVLSVLSAVALWFERDREVSEPLHKAFTDEAALGCTA